MHNQKHECFSQKIRLDSHQENGEQFPLNVTHITLTMGERAAKLLHMLSVKDVAARLGLSEWGARRLLYACKPLLDGMQGYGSHGEWLINSQAIVILERAKELRSQGVRLQDICAHLGAEMKPELNGSSMNQLQTSASHEQGDVQALVGALKEQIDYLKNENSWLRVKLDETLAKVPALPASESRRSWWVRLWNR